MSYSKAEFYYDSIIKDAINLEDGEKGMSQCIEEACKDYGFSLDEVEDISSEISSMYFNITALSHGIPKSVIEGKTQLSDHFSEEYIKSQTNKF